MTYERSLKFLFGLEKFGIKLGLSNILSFLQTLNNPQRNFPCVHVAGSNGKGSVCAMIFSILKEAGYKVGLYTSPHLVSFQERIRIGGKFIDEEFVSFFVSQWKKKIETKRYTFFEVITALAFSYFAQEKIDFGVIETGLGGRLDATNVLNPEVVVITSLSLEHTEVLGDNLKKIALEKSGIIKKEVPTILSPQKKEILQILEEVCQKRKSKLFYVPKVCHLEVLDSSIYGTKFHFKSLKKDYRKLEINLAGRHQLSNVSAALMAVEILRERGFKIKDENIKNGLKKAVWPARLQIFKKKPLVILDVAHNPEGSRVLTESLQQLLPEKKKIFVFGVMEDKDYPEMLKTIAKVASQIIITQPQCSRSASVEKLEKIIKKFPLPYKLIPSLKDAYKEALKSYSNNAMICITGSHFTVGEFLEGK